MNSYAEESDYSSSDGVLESRKTIATTTTTTTTDEEIESRNTSHGDALSILKHCDAATLEKLCGSFSNSTDSTVAYANFPKRSLVKCFSARDKYEWHMAQTAELENLKKKWEGVEEQIKQRNKTRQKRRVSSSREGASERRMRDSTFTDFTMDESSTTMDLLKSASKPRQGTGRRKLRRPSPHHHNKTPRKETPSPLIVNEDILQEALTIAENVQISDDSDLPSPLSSCLKTQSDSSETDFDANKRPSDFKARTNEAPVLASEPITTGLSSTEALEHSFSFQSITRRPSGRQMDSNGGVPPPRRKSHDRSSLCGIQGLEKGPQSRGSSLTMTEQQHMHNNNKGGVKNKDDLVKRSKASFSTPPVKALLNTTTTTTTPRGTKSNKNLLTKLQRGSGNAGSFRGALRHSFGSRHESVEYTSSPHSTSKTRALNRELSQGPSSRSLVKGSFKKASSFGGRSNLSSGGGGGSYGGIGSFGNLHPPSISGTRVWK